MVSIVEMHQKRLVDERRNFMIDIEEFKEISRSVLAKIIDNFELITCIRGKVIAEERHKFDYIYFIREGEFEISKLINMTVSTQ